MLSHLHLNFILCSLNVSYLHGPNGVLYQHIVMVSTRLKKVLMDLPNYLASAFIFNYFRKVWKK